MRAQARHLKKIARALTLMDRATSTRVPWTPWPEQDRVWELSEEHNRLVLVKQRKQGFSTAFTLPEVVDAMASDAEGQTVYYVTAIDTDEKASVQATTAVDFARQLGAKVRQHQNGMTFPRSGSEVLYATAGGKMAGRGTTIHRLRCTELPYWRRPQESYQSLRSACADQTPITIETTTENDPDGFMRGLWRGVWRDPNSGDLVPIGTEFHKEFFRVESHAPYRMDPTLISDAEWNTCRELHGFTDRAAASFWLRDALVNKAAGDMQRLLHDYPQAEWHLFAATSGRVITTTPEVAEVIERIPCYGVGGQRYMVEVYVKPEDCSGACVIPVDTAWGVNKTRSVILVVDLHNAKILASFNSPNIFPDDLARVTAHLWHTWQQRSPKPMHMQHRTTPLVEINGSGQMTSHELTKAGVAHVTMDQLKNLHTWGADACLKAAKRQIEAGLVKGPPELAEECDSLTKRDGRYEGLKDILMTYGMALIKRQELGVRDERWKVARKDIERVYPEDRMKEERRLAKMERGRRW